MTVPLEQALAEVRSVLLDPDRLVSAVASGRRRGATPAWRRVELRYVDLKAGRRLQVTTYDDAQAHTANHALGDEAVGAVDALLAEPFGNWHVHTTTESRQVRVTKKLAAAVHTRAHDRPRDADRGHDREKSRLLPPDDPVLVALGISTVAGTVKPSRQAKYRQVEEFLRLLDSALTDALANGHLRTPTPEQPLRIADLGCGNAYLTFAAHRFLTTVRDLPVRLTGVDTKQQSRDHNTEVAAELGIAADFVAAPIGEVELAPAPEVVLALHACDTATDDALARAVQWRAGLVLAAPCCHHDVARQLREAPAPTPYGELLRHGILRERLADTLTDALRAGLLREHGYRVDVVEFVESTHTPRNTLLRALLTRPDGDPSAGHEGADLAAAWSVRPRLAELLDRAR